jgi:hypothetical protein
MEKTFSAPLLASIFVFFALTLIFNHNLVIHPPKDLFYSPPPEYIEHFSIGFPDSMADSFWLRWVQDADNCQTYLKPVEKLNPNLKPTIEEMSNFYDPRHKICDNSWSFKMLDAITKISPRFRMPYLAGGTSLAIMTEDYPGATVIFERGLQAYPEDWDLSYRAAYHFLFDLKDKDRAAKLLIIAADHGGPYWLRQLAARLYTELGQLELGLRTLLTVRAGLKGDKGRAELDAKIADLKRRIQEKQSGASH